MSSAEFTEWLAYSTLEPFGEERADLRAATICAVTANQNRDRKRHPKPFTAADFMPKFGPRQKQSPDMLLAKARMAAALTGSRIVAQEAGAP